MKIEFDFEGRDEACALFALYAGLRMYYEHKKATNPYGSFSIAGAEAFCLLEDLRDQYEKEYWEAAAEFEHVYR